MGPPYSSGSRSRWSILLTFQKNVLDYPHMIGVGRLPSRARRLTKRRCYRWPVARRVRLLGIAIAFRWLLGT
jgi:hypothetical protein